MNNDYGQAIAGIFKSTFEGGGGQVLLSEGYQADETDFRSLLVKVHSERPDVLYIAGYFADTATVCRQARDVGFTIPLLGTTAIEDPQFLKLAGASAEGMVYPLATGFDPSDKDPVVASFVDSFKKRYGRDPGWVEAHCYDAFVLLCYAAQRADPPVTGIKIKAALDHLGDYHGVTGTIRFDINGDVVKPIVLKIVRNGRFTKLQ
jgi:branched-chain amino acid transport system substrate-binding protein